MSWPSLPYIPVYGVIKALRDYRQNRFTIYYKESEDALISSIICHAFYVISAAVLVTLLWR